AKAHPFVQCQLWGLGSRPSGRLTPHRTEAVASRRCSYRRPPDCGSPRLGGECGLAGGNPFAPGRCSYKGRLILPPTVGAPAPGANVGSSAETLSHRCGAPTKAD